MKFGRFLVPAFAAALFSTFLTTFAQGPAVRIRGPITGSAQVVLAGSRSPRALARNDIGALPAGTAIKGMTIVFNRTAAQQADLESLLAAQQNPASPLYHQWVTPDSFAARFGVASADIAAVESWLQSQGFSIEGVGRSKDRVSFTGTAGQFEAAFGAEIHQFKTGSEVHFAPATDISLPATLAPMVSGVLHTSDFRPRPSVLMRPRVKPAFTSSQSGDYYLSPADVATMYDVKAEYSAGFNGAGQSIAVIGQSYVDTSDVTNFQKAAGVAVHPPYLVLVPSTGVAGISTGDEGESDLDLEYASGMAPGANVYLVYVGNNGNYSVFDALEYAISEDIAPVVSLSYGDCEQNYSPTQLNTFSGAYQQAAAQGQTIVVAAGDEGSTACYGDTDASGNAEPLSFQEQPAVSFPASSPYVTGIGGTQMTTAALSTTGGNQYWQGATGSDVVSSLISYAPEMAWNEDSAANGLSSGGGGASATFARPSWQAGVTGIPAGSYRLVPDVSLLSGVSNPGYLYCSSDLSNLENEDLADSCTNGFRDSSGKYVLAAGGTSFATPIFAGLVAVLNQATHATGQGLLNTELYALGASSYSSVFHDITSGTNACTVASSQICAGTGATEFAATTGYDEATGLGSIDFAHLVSAWPSTASTGLNATVTTLSAANATATAGATDVITVTVAPTTAGQGTPTGSVTIKVDGTAISPSIPLVNGQATYTYTVSTTGGSHVITAAYSGDGSFAASSGAVTVTLAGSVGPAGSFSFGVSGLTVASGNAGNTGVTVTPTGGYNGNVVWTLSTGSAGSNVCYQMVYNGYPTYVTPISGTTQVTLEIGVGTAECGSVTTSPKMRPVTVISASKPGVKSAGLGTGSAPSAPWRGRPAVPVLAGLFAAGFAVRRRSRRLPMLLMVGLLTALGLGLSGCGSGTGTVANAPVNTPTNYSLTLTGTDSVTSSITSSTTFTLTVN